MSGDIPPLRYGPSAPTKSKTVRKRKVVLRALSTRKTAVPTKTTATTTTSKLLILLLCSSLRILNAVVAAAVVMVDPGAPQSIPDGKRNNNNYYNFGMLTRRSILATSFHPLVLTMGGLSVETTLPNIAAAAATTPTTTYTSADATSSVAPFTVITDPGTGYSALAYQPQPPAATQQQQQQQQTLGSQVPPLPPLLIFLHGAGTNQRDITNLIDPQGEHAGLLPSVVATKRAPAELLDEFAILVPYSYQKRSFYEEPRSKLLQFIQWVVDSSTSTSSSTSSAALVICHDNISDSSPPPQCPSFLRFDPQRIILFGFSDGATLSVELLTTRRFQAGIICSYGFTGTLPDLALQRLRGIPMWVFHSKDDRIFSVLYSDKLVQALRQVNLHHHHHDNRPPPNDDHDADEAKDEEKSSKIIRYSRFETDPENFLGAVRGHTTGITASKDPHVYQWLLSLSPSSS
jgi:predicted esterase